MSGEGVSTARTLAVGAGTLVATVESLVESAAGRVGGRAARAAPLLTELPAEPAALRRLRARARRGARVAARAGGAERARSAGAGEFRARHLAARRWRADRVTARALGPPARVLLQRGLGRTPRARARAPRATDLELRPRWRSSGSRCWERWPGAACAWASGWARSPPRRSSGARRPSHWRTEHLGAAGARSLRASCVRAQPAPAWRSRRESRTSGAAGAHQRARPRARSARPARRSPLQLRPRSRACAGFALGARASSRPLALAGACGVGAALAAVGVRLPRVRCGAPAAEGRPRGAIRRGPRRAGLRASTARCARRAPARARSRCRSRASLRGARYAPAARRRERRRTSRWADTGE